MITCTLLYGHYFIWMFQDQDSRGLVDVEKNPKEFVIVIGNGVPATPNTENSFVKRWCHGLHLSNLSHIARQERPTTVESLGHCSWKTLNQSAHLDWDDFLAIFSWFWAAGFLRLLLCLSRTCVAALQRHPQAWCVYCSVWSCFNNAVFMKTLF